MIRSLYWLPDGTLQTGLSYDGIKNVVADPKGVLWVDIAEEPKANCENVLREIFGFHPLAIEDALDETHVPKVNDWENYLYVVIHAVDFQPEQTLLDTCELDIFMGRGYLVTYQAKAIPAVEQVWTEIPRRQHALKLRPGNLLYVLADEIVDDYMMAIDTIAEVIEDHEDQIFSNPQPWVLEQVFKNKHGLLNLRRILLPQQEVFSKLARGDYEQLDPQDRVFFRDIYDHLVRLHSITESLRDIVSGALDIYLSQVNNRINEVMKTLAVFTALFMPLSFLTSFFGMNFFQPDFPLDFWKSLGVFFVLLGAMIILPVAMYIWIRKRTWL